MADKKSIGEKEKGLNFMQRLLQNDNARKIIVVVGVVAILVIFLSSFFGGNKKQTTNTETVQQTSASAQSVDDFKTQTEQSLTNLINGIEGVGNASVLVTIEKSSEQVYATEEKTCTQTQQDKNTSSTTKNQSNNSNETKYLVIKNSDGTQQPIAVTEVQPIVKGVVVVCAGGGAPKVVAQVTAAVKTALDISSAKITVSKISSGAAGH